MIFFQKINKTNNKLTILLLIAICILFLSLSFSYASYHGQKHVLVLNSYHKGYPWSDKIMEGISSILKAEAQDILIHIEYMDTKRIHDERHFQNLYDLYKHKFSGSKFDIIITSDDNAFKYILKYRNKLFPGTPAVFCGVNDFKDSMLIGHEQITGVVEDFDLKGTISVALKLHPQIKEIFVISGRTKTGMINVEKLKKVIPDF